MLIVKLVWAMMIATVAIFGFVDFFAMMPSRAKQAADQMSGVTSQTLAAPEATAVVQSLPPDKQQKLLIGFAMFSLVTGIASIVLRRKMANKEVMRRALEKEKEHQLTEYQKAEAQKDAQALAAASPAEATAARAVFAGYVISWAFSEAVAIHGFALSQILRDPWVYFYFGIPALILLVINRPRTRDIEETVREFNAANSG